MSNTIIARATREGGWWAVSFDSPTGTFHTQARRLDQVEGMVRDILDSEGVGAATIEVEPQIPTRDRQAVDQARGSATAAAEAVELAATRSREAVALLKADGLTVRDIGTLMGISPQRVSQLTS